MTRTDYNTKVSQYGDFYLYYQKETGRGATYLVGTADLDNSYIRAKLGHRPLPTVSSTQVIVWSWTSDKLRVIELAKVKRLTPLGAVLKNNRG